MNVFEVEVGDDAALLSCRMEDMVLVSFFAGLADGLSTADAAAAVAAATGLSLSEVGFVVALGAREAS